MGLTGAQIIASSMRVIGALAGGETPNGTDTADCLLALNMMIDSWSNEGLLIPNKVREVFALTGSQYIYTLGPSGNWNTTRPMRIEECEVQITSNSPLLELPVNIITKDQYAIFQLKTSTANFPQYVYPDNAFPLMSLNFWPVPTDANNIVLYSWKPLSNITNPATAFSLPPGYERALKYNLAIEIAPEFGKPVTPEIYALAEASKDNVKRMNTIPYYSYVDAAVRGKPAVFDWRTGELT